MTTLSLKAPSRPTNSCELPTNSAHRRIDFREISFNTTQFSLDKSNLLSTNALRLRRRAEVRYDCAERCGRSTAASASRDSPGGMPTIAGWTLAVSAQVPLKRVAVLASRCELDMTARRRLGGRRLLSWWGFLRWWWRFLRWRFLRLWCGSLRLRCGSFLLLRGGPWRSCSRWRCRDRRHERLYRRWGDVWRRIRRDVAHRGRPDRCGDQVQACSDPVHRLVRRGMRPFRAEPSRHRQLCTTDRARGGADQGGDHYILSTYTPPRHTHHRRPRSRYRAMRS